MVVRGTLFGRYPVIDVDTHITEPADTWTSRMSTSWGDEVPKVVNIDGSDWWVSGRRRLSLVGPSAMAGHGGYFPDVPATYADIHPAASDPVERLRHMDDQGIWAQVLYPNVGGFGASHWLKMGDQRLAIECVRTYNDFQTDFCGRDPQRLLPITVLPFWDLDASVAEVKRCLDAGHRGVNFCNQPDKFDQPPLFDPHWDPIWNLLQDAKLPVNFHIGGGDWVAAFRETRGMSYEANFARASALLLTDNMRSVADLIFGGVCHRFPELKFVSVESGVGALIGLLESFDWQWRNEGIGTVHHREYDLLPSEYFRRQMYACFWFERDAVEFAAKRYSDNILYETDFPHPTCQHPGICDATQRPEDYASEVLGAFPPALQRKVLFETASRIYRVQLPPAKP